VGRALDALWGTGLDRVYCAVIRQAIRPSVLKLARFHTDTTSLTVYGAYDREQAVADPLVTFDDCHDHRPDPKQRLLALTVTADGVPRRAGVGLCHQR
jgi:hypothetical protein